MRLTTALRSIAGKASSHKGWTRQQKAPPEGEALFTRGCAYRNTNLAMKIAVSTHKLAEISLKRPVPALSTT